MTIYMFYAVINKYMCVRATLPYQILSVSLNLKISRRRSGCTIAHSSSLAARSSGRCSYIMKVESSAQGCQELIFETLFFQLFFLKLSHSFPLFSFVSNTVTTLTTSRRGQDIVFYTPKRPAGNKW